MNTASARTRATWQVLRAQALQPSPWKNGGGVTRELAVFPRGSAYDDFIWRVSIADVNADGAFSRFPGIDRHIVLLEGAGFVMRYTQGGHAGAHVLDRPYLPYPFAGEADVDVTLGGGATRDFNLMVRRERASGQLALWHGAATHACDGDTALLYVARGGLALQAHDGEPLTLQAGDSALASGAHAGAGSAWHGRGLSEDTVIIAVRIGLRDAA